MNPEVKAFLYLVSTMRILQISAVFLLICGLSVPSSAQRKKNQDPTPVNSEKSINLDSLAYNKAIANNDIQTGIVYLYRLIAAHPQEKAYSDALVKTYFINGLYNQCARAAENHLKDFPDDLTILEIQAYALKNLGDVKNSLTLFEQLNSKNPKVGYGYRIAEAQYLLKRLGECTATIEKIVKSPDADSVAVEIVVGDQTQNVPVKAAALNIHGMVLLELSQAQKAAQSFEAAIKLFPEFYLAKANLEHLAKANAPKNPAEKTE